MATVTIKDIAKICGVGTSTVSRAINDDPGISKATKDKILRAVEEYHYVPNNAARNLKMTQSNTIGLLVKGVNNPFFQGMYQLFEQKLQANGYDMVLREIGELAETALVAEEVMKENRLKGMIFLGGRMVDPDSTLERLDIPYVLCTVAMNVTAPHCSSVAIDDCKESYELVDYLCKKGHRKIAMIAGRKDDFAISGLRLEGYQKALEDNGIVFDPELVMYSPGDLPEFSAAGGYAMMTNFLKKEKECTAVYCVSDLLAFGAYKAVYDAGKKIPEDYSFVGFDGIDLTQYMYPSLTTMEQPMEELVEHSVDELMKGLEGQRDYQKISLPAKLLERDSVRTIEL